jgi:glyoxylase-like metal-dependent hydrolase (beta-lactamase superfamily II)
VHVERFESALWQTSSVLLVAEQEAVAIDPGVSRPEVAALAERAEELGVRVTHVLATHADWDHVCGIAAFPDAIAAMGELTAQAVASGAPAELIARRAIEHDLEVAGAPRVDLALAPGVAHRIGPFTVETLALAGHTADGVGFRVRSLDVLVVGDHLSTVEFPFVSDTAAYRSTLAGLVDVLRHDPPAEVVSGHGPALGGDEALEIAEADLGYLRALRDAVARSLAAGGDRKEARDAGLEVVPPRPAEIAGMHASNVEAQLDEVLGAVQR